MVRSQHVIDSRKAVRPGAATTVGDFPVTQMDFRPSPDVAMFREAARAVLDTGDGLSGLLLADEQNYAAPEFRTPIKDHMRGLPADRQAAEFAQQPAGFFAGTIAFVDCPKVTRLETLQTTEQHESTGRAHLFLCARRKGIVPAGTGRRLAAQAGK